ncbi:replication restart DNA helicase PriA [Tepidamorphus gemmatus]|uniref:Replication restart protein PriA n=1 Tax=Tepidamorphus gemmatus TaxID=747076 RepID=A0A4R3M8H3_9HYPH|nr:primosomal protein N' [Tepidamorphus gemmatus]TCT09841.1 replication restart DNA helicase PriA [Tepidamorphus gemmatus]
MSQSIVPVLTPVAVEAPYSYAVPDGMTLSPGDVVVVPLGPRTVLGVVWDGEPDRIVRGKLRPVEAKLAGPAIAPAMRRFVEWIADYTLSPRGMVLRMMLRVPEAFGPQMPVIAVRLAGAPPERMTEARRRVLEVAGDGLAWSKTALARAAGVGVSVVEGLIQAGTLQCVALPPKPVVAPPEPDFAATALTQAQSGAAEALADAVAAGGFSVSLLEGVTGSGKTEVYFEAMSEALRRGRQVLVMVPEISLTAQFLARFEARFGTMPAEWHSGLTPKLRERTWRGVASGEVKAVAGARSALFLPFADLGLIVVDEEHDPAYKQEEGVIYSARDMAVVRGSLEGVPVVLSSATPSVESRANAERGRYRHLRLPDRYGARLPDIRAVDMRSDGPERGRFLSPPLVAAIAATIAGGEQALLFLNRRGYAPLTLCRACGFRFECPNCSAWLVEHRFRRQLACHHCGHAIPRPVNCPNCGAEDSLVPCGPGIERIAEEAAERFPDIRILMLSSDLIGSIAELRQRFTMIERGEVDLVVGTQLVAKGHNFPNLALVGVVDADVGLATGDPRAAERTFQLLQQVTGRAGRQRDGGRALIQTFDPDHPVIKAIVSGDREAFYAREMESRERQGLPPFGRLAAILVSARSQDEAASHAKALARAVPPADGVRVLGPAEAPLAVVRGRHRFRLLVKARRTFDLQGFLRAWFDAAPKPRGSVRMSVDVDPLSFL